MSVESDLPKDLNKLLELEKLISALGEKLDVVRCDPNLGDKIGSCEDLLTDFDDDYMKKIDLFTQYHAQAFEKWRIPQMVSAYKLSTGNTRLPTNPNAFFAAFPQIPEWRKRQGGIRTEIVSDLAETMNTGPVERSPSKWLYFMMQLIDTAENHTGVHFGVDKEFERFVRDNPLKDGLKLSMYTTVAYYTFDLLLVLDPKKAEEFIDGVQSVRNVYTFLARPEANSDLQS